MTDLITRLSKLDAPDREVDGEIMQAIDSILWSKAYFLSQEPCGCSKEMATEEAKLRAPAYTASVDAAIALAERVLPGWGKFLRNDADGNHAGMFIPVTLNVIQGRGATLAIALCIALLRAKEASKP